MEVLYFSSSSTPENVVGMCYYSPVSYVLLHCSVYKSKGTRASHIHAELIQSDLIRSSLTQWAISLFEKLCGYSAIIARPWFGFVSIGSIFFLKGSLRMTVSCVCNTCPPVAMVIRWLVHAVRVSKITIRTVTDTYVRIHVIYKVSILHLSRSPRVSWQKHSSHALYPQSGHTPTSQIAVVNRTLQPVHLPTRGSGVRRWVWRIVSRCCILQPASWKTASSRRHWLL